MGSEDLDAVPADAVVEDTQAVEEEPAPQEEVVASPAPAEEQPADNGAPEASSSSSASNCSQLGALETSHLSDPSLLSSRCLPRAPTRLCTNRAAICLICIVVCIASHRIRDSIRSGTGCYCSESSKGKERTNYSSFLRSSILPQVIPQASSIQGTPQQKGGSKIETPRKTTERAARPASAAKVPAFSPIYLGSPRTAQGAHQSVRATEEFTPQPKSPVRRIRIDQFPLIPGRLCVAFERACCRMFHLANYSLRGSLHAG